MSNFTRMKLNHPDPDKPFDPFNGREIEAVPQHVLMRWSRALKGADQYALAEEIFPETPAARRETEQEQAA